MREGGGLHILVSNAGHRTWQGAVPDVTEAEWDACLDTNLKGAFLACKHAIPHLRAGGGGSVVFTSSNAGLLPRAHDPVYCTSKAARDRAGRQPGPVSCGRTRFASTPSARTGLRTPASSSEALAGRRRSRGAERQFIEASPLARAHGPDDHSRGGRRGDPVPGQRRGGDGDRHGPADRRRQIAGGAAQRLRSAGLPARPSPHRPAYAAIDWAVPCRKLRSPKVLRRDIIGDIIGANTCRVRFLSLIIFGKRSYETPLQAAVGCAVVPPPWRAARLGQGRRTPRRSARRSTNSRCRTFAASRTRSPDLKDAKLVVVAFLGVECPLSKLYGPRLAELAKQYESKGVAFLGVDSNRQDSVTEMAQYAKVHEHRLSAAEGSEQRAGRQAGRGPQSASVRARRRSHGSLRRPRSTINTVFKPAAAMPRPRVNSRDLARALDELLAGKAVSQPTTEAIGCLIGRVRKADSRQRSDLLEADRADLPGSLRRVPSAGTDRSVRAAEATKKRSAGPR